MLRAILFSISLSIALSALTACPNSSDNLSPREACEGVSVALCERIYTCLSAEELAAAGFPGNEAACVTAMDQSQGCSAQTLDNACDGNETFHAAQAETCLDQLAGLDCGQLRSDDLDLASAAPACNLVCSID
jgi:hypothetical protein